jgi:hypothetical protein
MGRLVFSCVAVAGMGLGACMVVWPGWVALKSRDEGDTHPPTAGETSVMRAIGAALFAGCGYGLYALLTGMPGADFLTP